MDARLLGRFATESAAGNASKYDIYNLGNEIEPISLAQTARAGWDEIPPSPCMAVLGFHPSLRPAYA
jgi:hypothetical protein